MNCVASRFGYPNYRLCELSLVPISSDNRRSTVLCLSGNFDHRQMKVRKVREGKQHSFAQHHQCTATPDMTYRHRKFLNQKVSVLPRLYKTQPFRPCWWPWCHILDGPLPYKPSNVRPRLQAVRTACGKTRQQLWETSTLQSLGILNCNNRQDPSSLGEDSADLRTSYNCHHTSVNRTATTDIRTSSDSTTASHIQIINQMKDIYFCI